MKQIPVILMAFSLKTASAIKLMKLQTEAILRPRAELFLMQLLKKHMSEQTENQHYDELS